MAAKTHVEKLQTNEAKLEEKLKAVEAELNKNKLFKDYIKTKDALNATTCQLIEAMVEEVTDDSEPGDAVDLYRQIKDFSDRIKLSMKNVPEIVLADTLKTAFDTMQDKLVSLFHARKITQATGRVGKVSIANQAHPNIRDWDKFLKWMVKTDNYQLLNKSVKGAAYRELLDEKVNVVGVDSFDKPSIRIGKR